MLFEVAWDSVTWGAFPYDFPINFDLTAYCDITSDVMDFVTERGRDSELGEVQIGTIELTVKNNDGKYSPENAASPLYGYLKPGKPIRVRATYDGSTYYVFRGEIDRITPNPDRDRRTAYILGTGMLRRFKTNITTALQTDQTEAELLATITAAVQKSGETLTTDFDTGLDTYGYAWWQEDDALKAAMEIASGSQGTFFEEADGTIRFDNRNARATATSQATFDNTGYAYGMRYNYGSRELYNRVTTPSYAREVQGSATLWTLQETPLISPGETRTFTAVLDDPASAITTPAATTDYTANDESGGGGADRTADVSFVITKYGQSATLEVTNDGAPAFYLTLLQLRGTELTVSDTGNYQADDTTSQGDYGILSNDYPGIFVDSIGWAEDRSRLVLAKKKDPQSEIEMTLRPRDGTTLTQMLAREIGDRITVIEDNTAVNGDFFIEQISQKGDRNMVETKWTLSAAPSFEVWILGTSTLGINTGLGY